MLVTKQLLVAIDCRNISPHTGSQWLPSTVWLPTFKKYILPIILLSDISNTLKNKKVLKKVIHSYGIEEPYAAKEPFSQRFLKNHLFLTFL